MKFTPAFGLSLCCVLASAGAPASSPVRAPSYVVQALAPAHIEGLLAGKGLGYAKAAELNHYPGPAHVLELADRLSLSPQQLEATRAIHARMLEQAKHLGTQRVAAEAALERLFRENQATEHNVRAALERIGQLEAELRGVHMLAHIEQRALLSGEQIARYMVLRGHQAPGQDASNSGH